MSVHPLAKQITEEVMGGAPFAVGDVVEHPDGYPVRIVSGTYWAKHGLSNFWSWKRVDADGTPYGETQSGYGWRQDAPASDLPKP